MDIISKFSLVDFLAYLFPGIVSTAGLYMLLLLTPLENSQKPKEIDLLTIVLILSISYVIGVILSGFAEIGVKEWTRRRSNGWARKSIPVPGFQEDIKAAFNNIFADSTTDNTSEWSVTHFHLCRSIVFQFMPGIAQSVIRQGSLRELRANLIPSITIWAIVGIGWGISLIRSNDQTWGYTLLIGSIILWFPIVSTILNRMHSNETREVREILIAFLAGYKNGLFKQTNAG